MATKKELEVLFNISDNTVYKTLQACGLDTAKTEYSILEIKEFFEPARKMLDAGKGYRDVELWARKKRSHVPDASQEQKADEGEARNDDFDFGEAVRSEVSQIAEETINAAVRDVIPHLPAMLRRALEKEAQKGSIREAFKRSRGEFIGNVRQSFGEYYQEEKAKRELPGMPSSGDDDDVIDVTPPNGR